MLNLQVQTLTTVARDGMPIVLITAVWLGKIVEVDTYRASDMTQLEAKTLKSNGGH